VDMDVPGAGEQERITVVVRTAGRFAPVHDAPLGHRDTDAAQGAVRLENATGDLLAQWDASRIHFPSRRDYILN
jgi:hypothetical protein